jgi:hypothetical protein
MNRVTITPSDSGASATEELLAPPRERHNIGQFAPPTPRNEMDNKPASNSPLTLPHENNGRIEALSLLDTALD